MVTLLTGGIDNHYAWGLGRSLAASGIAVDLVCNADLDRDEVRQTHNVRLEALYGGSRQQKRSTQKLLASARVYLRVIRYIAKSSSPIVHILWDYKVPLFDRTILSIFYKAIGKQVVFTAHNINAADRDGVDSFINRLSLRVRYRVVDHIFVHTDKMKDQLVERFGVRARKITVIPFGAYDMVPQTALTTEEARMRLGLRSTDRVVLFFGRIAPYKGIDLLVDAFGRIAPHDERYRLVIAGEPMKEMAEQWAHLQHILDGSPTRHQVRMDTRFIADNEIESYFKAADVLVLPYTQIFQSGVLFMAYSFGLPVIASDVGSFGEDIIEGVTGFISKPADPEELANTIDKYFSSELFRNLPQHRAKIWNAVQERHSWKVVAAKTSEVYNSLSA